MTGKDILQQMPILYTNYSDKYKIAVEKLLTDLVDYLAQYNSLRRATAHEDFGSTYLEKILNKISDNKGSIILAVDQEIVVGCLVGTIKEYQDKELLEYLPTKIGFISDLYVIEAYRSKGIASTLMQKIEEFFRKENCKLVEIGVMIENSQARDLYEKLGYKNNYFELRRKLLG